MGILGFSQVRHARPEDEDRIVDLIRVAHDENGLFPLAEDRVRSLVRTATDQKGAMIGLIDNGTTLQGALCVEIEQAWYTHSPCLLERFNFVHPDHRQSSHAKSLIQFAKSCADTLGVPLLIGVIATKRTEAKVRLYRRQLQPVGAYFMHFPVSPALNGSA